MQKTKKIAHICDNITHIKVIYKGYKVIKVIKVIG